MSKSFPDGVGRLICRQHLPVDYIGEQVREIGSRQSLHDEKPAFVWRESPALINAVIYQVMGFGNFLERYAYASLSIREKPRGLFQGFNE